MASPRWQHTSTPDLGASPTPKQLSVLSGIRGLRDRCRVSTAEVDDTICQAIEYVIVRIRVPVAAENRHIVPDCLKSLCREGLLVAKCPLEVVGEPLEATIPVRVAVGLCLPTEFLHAPKQFALYPRRLPGLWDEMPPKPACNRVGVAFNWDVIRLSHSGSCPTPGSPGPRDGIGGTRPPRFRGLRYTR